MSIRDKLLQAVERYALLERDERVLVGVSGGQDSVCLACLLADLRVSWGVELLVAHLHHGLRGEAADADQKRVAALAQELGCSLHTEQIDVGAMAREEKIGIEEAGRRARYDFFHRVAAEQDCARIALGHTATDRAETLLMNLFRGAGVHGLRSIPPRRGKVIRPLVLVTRQETEEFCRKHGLEVCEDSYNSDLHYFRNQVRCTLMPYLEREFGPGIEGALCRAAGSLGDELEWTEPLVEQALAEVSCEGGVRAADVAAMPRGLRYRVLREFLKHARLPLADLSADRWLALERLVVHGGTGKRMELPDGCGVELEYGTLKVYRPPASARAGQAVVSLRVPGTVRAPGGRAVEGWLNDQPPSSLPQAHDLRAVLDAARTGRHLLVRLAREGDRFTPLGMQGTKKLQDFFTDNKVPRGKRRPLVVTREDGEILWVVGHRLAETAKIEASTSEYLLLRVSVDADLHCANSRRRTTFS